MPKLAVLRLLALAAAPVLLWAPAAGATAAPGPDTTPADPSLARLLRMADIEGDTIVFSYAGDLWAVGAEGGQARRLTTHPGIEQFPKLSPDGTQVAFTADYSGTRQVHVMSITGGEPRQLTFYNDVGPLPPRGGVDNRVLDWTPDGSEILFLPHRLGWGERMGVPYLVPAAGGMERPLGPPEGGGGMFSPDGTKLVYTPIEREFRTWKRHRGGRAQDVWIYDLVANTSEQLTDFRGTDNQPMWIGNTIYFTSDRTGILNLWAYDLATRETRQVTHFTRWDVLWPSAGRDRIVFEAGGWIWRFDPRDSSTVRVPIHLDGDFRDALPRRWAVGDDIESAELSPSGARAVFGARGDVFTVPAKDGEPRNLTRTPGIREHSVSWSPDGQWVAYLSDRTGEYEIYVRRADGSGEERQVTRDGRTWRFAPSWSPDSKLLAFGDRTARLWVVDVATGAATEVDRGVREDITHYRWSPDSRWLVYSRSGENQNQRIVVWSAAERRTYELSDGSTNDTLPVFDPKGRYLYFRSDRDFNLTFSGYEFDFLYTRPNRIYVALLTADTPSPFLPKSDEEPGAAATPAKGTAAEEKEGKKNAKPDAKNGEAASAASPAPVRIDLAGFADRVRAIPGPSGGYGALEATAAGPLYLRMPAEGPATLYLYDLEAREEKSVLAGINGFSLSADGNKLLWSTNDGSFGIADAKPGQDTGKGRLALAKLEVELEPRAEWRQVFVDAWRLMRDWFYDPAMHGLDWPAMRAKYEELLPWVAHRADLDYVLGELGGELNAGHVYVETNNDWQVERRNGALLGAELVADPSGYFRIAKIFPGENWSEEFRSPLTEPGVRAKVGDLVLAIDGVSTKGVDNVYRLLAGKGDRTITLTLNDQPTLDGAHQERIRPITRETNLRYLDWVRSRREMVSRLSGGKIGYIHLPNTGPAGARELYKGFYAQAHEQALILDDRYNGGGFIPFYMIDLLSRPLLSYWARRDQLPFTTPGYYNLGPKAVLMNGYSSSGGDAFPYYFRQRGLGPLIGTRTWGGLIGLSGNPDLMDGGSVNVPTFRFIDPATGAWAVENEGVAPDIEVIDRPELVVAGRDPSLEKAVEVLLAELAKNPPQPLTVPPPPNETGAP
jgi:tricorn protease